MRITPDMPVGDLYHNETESEELVHWLKRGEQAEDHKYVKREWRNGRWQYWYANDNLGNKTSNVLNSIRTNVKTSLNKAATTARENTRAAIDKAADKALAKANDASKGLDNIVNKAKDTINKFYDDPNNMYDVNSTSYEQKMAKIKDSKEWQDIVARKDPEYVKKNADGSTTYLLDDYVVKKKHPVLDVVSDIASGRKVDINEITKDSTVAGLKEYAIGSIRTGALAVGIVSTVLTEKFKLQQGTYDDDIKALTQISEKGADYVDNAIKTASTVSNEDIERMAKAVREGQKAAEATRTINEGNIVKAAQLIIESEKVRDTVGDNQYYKQATAILSNLSEEEIEALNLLLKQMRK